MHMLPVESSNAVKKEWAEMVNILADVTIFNSGRTDESLMHDQNTSMIIITKEWRVGLI